MDFAGKNIILVGMGVILKHITKKIGKEFRLKNNCS